MVQVEIIEGRHQFKLQGAHKNNYYCSYKHPKLLSWWMFQSAHTDFFFNKNKNIIAHNRLIQVQIIRPVPN